MNQENGSIKQMKLRIPMELFYQLSVDAKYHREPPSTRARHILIDALMHVDISSASSKQEIKRLTDLNWKKLKGGE